MGPASTKSQVQKATTRKEVEKQPISIKKILESNEMDYEKFEDIYDPILETELTTEDSPISKILDYEGKEEDREGEDDEEEASVFSHLAFNHIG